MPIGQVARSASNGFTLIELMVTVSIFAIILGLGIPNLRTFLVRNQAAQITTEFASDVSRARIEAINRNNCVTICLSANTANALTGGTPSCDASGSNWQAGWIIFSNPTCSATENDPTSTGAELIAVRQAGLSNFQLTPESGTLTRLIFESRGISSSGQQNLKLQYLPEPATSPHYRSICLSTAGRVTTKIYGGSGACP